jgi:hypothetical protein
MMLEYYIRLIPTQLDFKKQPFRHITGTCPASCKTVNRKELAEIVRAYQENRDAEIIPPSLVTKL